MQFFLKDRICLCREKRFILDSRFHSKTVQDSSLLPVVCECAYQHHPMGVTPGMSSTQIRNDQPSFSDKTNTHCTMAIINSSKYDDFDGPNRLPSSAQVDISGFIGLTIEALALCGNIFPALTVFGLKRRRKRTVTEYLIGALAINDLLSVAVPLCVGIPTLLNRRWIGDKLSCELYQISVYWFLLNAMLLVTIMSCDRYLALARPIFYKQCVSKRMLHVECLTLIMCCTTLAISCLPLLGFANNGISRTSAELTHCPCLLISKPTSSRERVFPVLLVSLGYLTLLVVSFCSIAVIRLLKDFTGRFQARGTETGLIHMETLKVDRLLLVSFTKLVVLLGALFYLTWMPVMVSDRIISYLFVFSYVVICIVLYCIVLYC